MIEANRLAEAACEAMAIHAIPPTPQNYMVWYNYVAQTMPPLRAAMDRLIAQQAALTDEMNADIYKQYFGTPDDHVDVVETGSHLHAAIELVGRYLNDHVSDVGKFGNHLDRFSKAVGRSPPIEQVRSLFADLVQETEAMARRNALLENRLGRIGGEVRDLRENLQLVRRESLTDSLTGIPNRKFFDTRLSRAAREACIDKQPLSLVIGDIDHFKRFNDDFGHQVGDQILRLVAQRLANLVKGRDTPARFGGEEFAIVLPRTNLDQAAIVAEHIRQAVMCRRFIGKSSRDDYGSVTLSFGVAEYRFHEELNELIARADAALYHAKRSGRNRVSTERIAVKDKTRVGRP